MAARVADIAVLDFGLDKSTLNFPEEDYKPGSAKRKEIDAAIQADLAEVERSVAGRLFSVGSTSSALLCIVHTLA